MSECAGRVLIVEDDVSIARVLERTLNRDGFVARVAEDGRTALAALEAELFHFVLCDYQLPDISGEELCRHIRGCASHAEVALALCTAKAHEVDVTALTDELGLTHVFYKPFSLREVSAAIGTAIQKHAVSSASVTDRE
ncbi:MAG TPA: response regulator [Planctomycetaceae bacterium]|nr:response regulator [Planctomycetaceae bacterium]